MCVWIVCRTRDELNTHTHIHNLLRIVCKCCARMSTTAIALEKVNHRASRSITTPFVCFRGCMKIFTFTFLFLLRVHTRVESVGTQKGEHRRKRQERKRESESVKEKSGSIMN